MRSFSTFHHACVRTSVNCDLDLILGGLRSQRRRTNIGDDIQREREEEVKRLTPKYMIPPMIFMYVVGWGEEIKHAVILVKTRT